MNKSAKVSLFLLRLSMGWLFFYAGITKVLNPEWTAEGYLKSAKILPQLFNWFALPENIGWVNFVNEWGLTLIGALLILGLFVRWASLGGIVLMVLYYLPILDFPYPNTHSYIVDEHIIYFFVFFLFYTLGVGRFWGLDKFFNK